MLLRDVTFSQERAISLLVRTGFSKTTWFVHISYEVLTKFSALTLICSRVYRALNWPLIWDSTGHSSGTQYKHDKVVTPLSNTGGLVYRGQVILGEHSCNQFNSQITRGFTHRSDIKHRPGGCILRVLHLSFLRQPGAL